MKENLSFVVGQPVEVSNNDELQDSWSVATIIYLPKNPRWWKGKKLFVVEYENLNHESGQNPLTESVEFTRLRPLPPREPVPRNFHLNEEVDVFFNDVWWKGVITEIPSGGSDYLVSFNRTKEVVKYSHSKLRTHLDWFDGKWVKSQNQETMESVEVKLPDETCDGTWIPATILEKINDNSFLVTYKRFQSGDEVEELREIDCFHIRNSTPCSSHEKENGSAPSTDMATLKTSIRLGDVSKELSSRNKFGRVEKQSNLHGTDSPADVISRTKSVFKNVRDRAVRKGPTLRACHSRGTKLADAQDEFYFPSTKSECNVIEVERSQVSDFHNPHTEPKKEQHGVLPTGEMKEVLCSSRSKLEVGRVETKTTRALKRKRTIDSCINNFTKENKRGRAATHAVAQQKVYTLALPAVRLEKEYLNKGSTDRQRDCTPFSIPVVEEHQPVPAFTTECSSLNLEGIKGPDHEISSKGGANVDTEHTQTLSHADKEQFEVPNLPDETANKEVTVDETEHAQTLSHIDKEHFEVPNFPDETASKDVTNVDTDQAQRPSHADKEHLEVPNFSDCGGSLLDTSNGKITPRDSSMEDVSHNRQGSFAEEDTNLTSDNARGNDRGKHSWTTTMNTLSSPKQQDDGRLPQQDERFTSIKRVWETSRCICM